MSRTGVDFSKHEHRVEKYFCGDKCIQIDHFQVPGSYNGYIQFINTDDVLTVTGDYGNWVFCRPFAPSSNGYVSDGYWLEKLRTSSSQNFENLDFKSIVETLKEDMNEFLTDQDDYDYEHEKVEEIKEWYEELISCAESGDQVEYMYKAYRDSDMPDFFNYSEKIPYYKEIPTWLNIIFDAFDEMCNRLFESEPIKKGDKVKLPFDEEGVVNEVHNTLYGFKYDVKITKATLSKVGEIADFFPKHVTKIK